MELHNDSGSFAPDQHCDSPLHANTISPARRHWRMPAVATSSALVAALCLYTGSAAQASVPPTTAKAYALTVKAATTTTGEGGVHGAFNLYNGAGGGVEFWFDPSTGSLTVAVGTGVGALGGGVLGTYAYGTVPAAGTYLYTDATLSAGTVTTVNLAGTYSLVNGVSVGSVSATVEGRTLTITSDGSSTFKATVTVATNATGWTSPAYYYNYDFYYPDLLDFLYPPIEIPTPYPDPDPDPDDYSLLDTDAGNSGTTVYSDASGTDGTVVSSDGSPDTGSVSSDDDSSDDSSSGDDSGDDSGGGGGGRSDDSTYPIESESFSSTLVK